MPQLQTPRGLRAATSSARSQLRQPSPSPAPSRRWATTPRRWRWPDCSRTDATTTSASAGAWSTVRTGRSPSISSADRYTGTDEIAGMHLPAGFEAPSGHGPQPRVDALQELGSRGRGDLAAVEIHQPEHRAGLARDPPCEDDRGAVGG